MSDNPYVPKQAEILSVTQEAGGRRWEITVLGAPTSKKTSNEIHLTVHKTKVAEWVRSLLRVDPSKLMRAILSRVRVQPSKRWRQWAKHAPIMTPGIDPSEFPIAVDLHIKAVVYRQRAVGDWLGFMQGLADLLQDRNVVVNDRQFICWDESRLDKDRDNPRVEVTLRELER